MNSVHSELLANRSLQGERNRASANNFYQQHHVNIMRHLVYNPQNSSQPAINDPTMMFFMPVSDTALFLNRNISETQVHATIIAAATAAAAAAGISEVQPVGISLSEIKKHSTKMNYVKNQETPEEEKERCIICLIDLENDDEIRILNCTHLFHVECIDKWYTIIILNM
jgi:hypothetical protein